EEDLSRRLGISRASLREALKAVAVKGLVETRTRRGTSVNDALPSASGSLESARTRGKCDDNGTRRRDSPRNIPHSFAEGQVTKLSAAMPSRTGRSTEPSGGRATVQEASMGAGVAIAVSSNRRHRDRRTLAVRGAVCAREGRRVLGFAMFGADAGE